MLLVAVRCTSQLVVDTSLLVVDVVVRCRTSSQHLHLSTVVQAPLPPSISASSSCTVANVVYEFQSGSFVSIQSIPNLGDIADVEYFQVRGLCSCPHGPLVPTRVSTSGQDPADGASYVVFVGYSDVNCQELDIKSHVYKWDAASDQLVLQSTFALATNSRP